MLLVDGHVHIYEQFNLNDFFSSAFFNFAKAAETMGLTDYTPVMVLADRPGENWCHKLASLWENTGTGKKRTDLFWVEKTCEEESLIVRGRNPETETVFLIAGRKIITRENLEVLALGASRDFPRGRSLRDTVEAVEQSGAVPAVAWAAGKWLGKRGKALDALLDDPGDILYLCDNGNRPGFWKWPRHFRAAEEKDIRIISGTDAFNLPACADRTGRVGFVLNGVLSSEFPAHDMRRYLKDHAAAPCRYGPLETGFLFLKNQVLIRMPGARSIQAGNP